VNRQEFALLLRTRPDIVVEFFGEDLPAAEPCGGEVDDG
jgi:hypothetical protein